MADELSYNSPFDNSNLYSTIHYLEKDVCPYTEKNPHDSITLKGDSENENDCYYGNYKNPFQDECKFDETIEEKENNGQSRCFLLSNTSFITKNSRKNVTGK